MNLNTRDYYEVHWTQAGMKHKKEFPEYKGAATFARGLRNVGKADQILVRRSVALELLKR